MPKTYQYFIEPITPLANARLNEMPAAVLHNEHDNLYEMLTIDTIKVMFKIKFATQGTGGRASKQPIDFNLWRRSGNDGTIKKMTDQQIEYFLRHKLHLKPKYLQTASQVVSIG